MLSEKRFAEISVNRFFICPPENLYVILKEERLVSIFVILKEERPVFFCRPEGGTTVFFLSS